MSPPTVTATDRSFTSLALNQGESFSQTFTRAGTYNYFCAIHTSMKGVITVH